MAGISPEWKACVLTVSTNQSKLKEAHIKEYHHKVGTGKRQKSPYLQPATERHYNKQANRKSEKQHLHCHEAEWLSGDGTKAQLHQRSSERPRWDIHTGGPAWSLENEAELHTGTGSRHQTTTPHQKHGPGRMTGAGDTHLRWACAHGLWRMLPVRQPWLRTEKLPEDNVSLYL